MRIAFFGDLHVADKAPLGRIDDYRTTILNKLREISNICLEQEVDYCISTGDLFHIKRPNRVSHSLVQEMIEIFRGFPCEVFAIQGNHDQGPEGVESIGKQPLGVLEKAGVIKILSSIKDSRIGVWIIPRPYNSEGDADPMYYALSATEIALLESNPAPTIMVAHGSVLAPRDERPYPYVNVDELPNVASLDLFVAGHIHENLGIHTLKSGTIFANVGSIGRTARTQANYVRKVQMLIANIDQKGISVESVEIPGVPPAFEVFEGKEMITNEAPNEEIKKFVERLGEGLRSEELTIDELLASLENLKPSVKVLLRTYLEEAN